MKTLSQVAPQLIYCSISGFGSDGPYKNRAGYDVIAASLGGLMHITGPEAGSFEKIEFRHSYV
jgi:succinate--hydroxymethylglutarate CoA-transferase